jgi:xanthine dehydrogenase accessory factor
MSEADAHMPDLSVLEQVSELARAGEPFALATVVWRQGPSSSQQGSKAIITGSGELRGWIGGACAEPAVLREAREVITSGVPRLLLLGEPGQFGGAVPEGMRVVPIACQSEGALEVYIEPVMPAPHLVIVGRSPMAQALGSMAGALGWRTTLVAGEEFTTADAGERSMVVVATQGQWDEEALEQAIRARPAYLGLVASRRRGAAVLGYLAERGLDQEQLDRVRVPAGLDLGRTTHQEIAVAVLAELVQLRAAGALAGPAGRDTAAGRVGGAAASEESAGGAGTGSAGAASAAGGEAAPGSAARGEAVDPVCGMTVAAGPSGRPLTHDGQTYYFCSARCRREFEADPAAYARKESRC